MIMKDTLLFAQLSNTYAHLVFKIVVACSQTKNHNRMLSLLIKLLTMSEIM